MISMIFYICILYSIILFIQYKYIKADLFYNKFDNILDEKIEFNNKNYEKLKEIFSNILKERQQLLQSGKMNYNEWIKYNNDNTLITVGKHKYFIWIYEQLGSDNQIITKVHVNKELNDLAWVDVVKEGEEYLRFTKYTSDPLVINNMFKMSSLDYINTISGYWIDEMTNRPVKKEGLFLKFYDKQQKKTGVIGIGFEISDISKLSSFRYVDYINKIYFFMLTIIILIVSIVTIIINDYNNYSFFKSIWFIILSNTFIFLYLNSKEQSSTTNIELEKVTNVNSGMLSTSFLVGVNVYILTTLNKFKESKTLFIESAILFGFSIFLLLISSLGFSNYSSMKELIIARVSKQFVFNYSIILNIFIIINFLLFFLRNKKII